MTKSEPADGGLLFPSLEDLLPDAFDRAAFDRAYAAREAGAMVRAWRLGAGRTGITQSELGKRANLSQARISAIENGDGPDGPTYGLLKRLAAACGAEWPTYAPGRARAMSDPRLIQAGPFPIDHNYAVGDEVRIVTHRKRFTLRARLPAAEAVSAPAPAARGPHATSRKHS